MLSQKHKVNYHRMIITKVIDGVCYLLTHGHWKFSNRPLSEVFFDYGKQGMYNVMLKGHLHIRDAKKAQSTSTVEVDKVGYRSINVASLFTGNFYSESLGFTSSSGFSWLEASRTKRNVRHEDIPIG
jgi:calcineurin-like phosphoesterase family protein